MSDPRLFPFIPLNTAADISLLDLSISGVPKLGGGMKNLPRGHVASVPWFPLEEIENIF